MAKERNLYIDILKAVTIFMVVIGHCIQYGGGSENLAWGAFLYNPVFIFIYSFHMPLFMLISGYLFAFSCKRKSTKELLVGKVKQVIIPLFCWSFVSMVVEIIKIIVGVSTSTFSIVWMGQTILSAFWHGPWFLWAIWWCSFVVIIGRRFCKDNILFYLGICVLTLLVPDVNNTAVYKFMLPFFILAYLFNDRDLKVKLRKYYLHFAFIIPCFALYVFLLPRYNFDTYIYTTGYTIFGKNIIYQLHNDCFRFVIGLVGSICMVYLVYALVRVAPEKMMKPLSYVGKCTMGIYLISNYFFDEVLKRMPIPRLSFIYVALEFVCVLGLSLLINATLQRYKTTNRLFLGGR